MKLKSIFLSIFIFAFAVVTPLTHISADTGVIIGGNDDYNPLISVDDLTEDIMIPGILGSILYYGGEIFFGDPITYDDLVGTFTDAINDFGYDDIYKEILRRSPANDLVQWNPSDADGSYETWQEIFYKCSNFWFDNINLAEVIAEFVPEPDLNYLQYIDKINNCSSEGDFVGIDFFWKYTYFSQADVHFIDNPSHYSYIQTIDGYNNGGIITGSYATGQITASDILTVNINSYQDQYAYTISGYNNQSGNIIRFGTNNANWGWNALAISNGYLYGVINGQNIQPPTTILSGTGSLADIFYKLSNTVRNVNIFVDGVPWSIVYNPNSTNVYNITPTTYIQGTETPIQYVVPQDTYFDYVKMKNYIISAINNSGVLKYEDIEDCFVDINGVTAVYTVEVLRNDFDDMFDELYSPIYYPKFSVDTQLQPYVENGVNIINNAVGIIPDDILKVLIYGCSITLFAFLVKKLIE